MKRIALGMVIMAALVFATTPLWAASPIGKWKTLDDKSGKPMTITEVYEAKNGTLAAIMAKWGLPTQFATQAKIGEIIK